MLVLPIKKKSLNMILSGEKNEDYREVKPYYDRTLGKQFIGFTFTKAIIDNFESIKEYNQNQIKNEIEIIFRNGQDYNSSSIKCLCSLAISLDKKYYILQIRKILEKRIFNC